MLEPEIIIFANTYKCPLDKRCENCVFNNLVNVPIHQSYHEIKALAPNERNSLVQECQNCQKASSELKSVEEEA